MSGATSSPIVRRALGAVTVAALAAALTGCSVIGSFFGQGNAFTIKVGDCFNQPDFESEEITTVEFVDCTEPHDYEATKSVILTETAHPGDDALLDRGDTECHAAFSEYTGQSYESFTDYDYDFYWPTTGSWAGGDREILCLIYHVEERSTLSVRNFSG